MLHRLGNQCVLTIVLSVLTSYWTTAHGQHLVSDFNSTGFDWLCCGFSQTIGSEHVTLQSDDGWGIGDVLTGGVDFTGNLDDHFRIRVRTNDGNGAENFTLALLDSNSNEAKWSFDVANETVGEWVSLRSGVPLANPTHGINDWQNIDMADIQRVRLLGHWEHPGPFNMSFDQIDLTPYAYEGMAPDASWRTEAAERIDSIRKADLQVQVTDHQGHALPGATVDVEMKRHEFGFGSALQAWRIRDDNPEHEAYKQKVVELFNKAVLENNLKWIPWEGNWGSYFSQDGAIAALDWLAENQITARGHNLVWPSIGHVPEDVDALLQSAPLSTAQQQQLRDRIASHISDVATAVAGRVSAWDVINEPRSERDVMDVLPEGNAAMSTWFQAARDADPNAKLYLNDYSIVTGENSHKPNQDLYYEQLETLIENNAPIDGVGFQGHFRESSLTSPERLWKILDRFDALGLDMQITEFDFETTNEDLQAAYTRDFMTAVFAHEGIDDFLMWGFWESAHWRPEAAMFREDWSIKPNGQAFMGLVFAEWWTDESETTDHDGTMDLRAFKGDYEIEVDYFGVMKTINLSLSDDGTTMTVSMPVLLGDLNNDLALTATDIDLLASNSGAQAPDPMADLNGSGQVDAADRDLLVTQLIGTWFGDSNLDLVFDSRDLVQVFRLGQYDDGIEGNSTWGSGDWTGDHEFDSSDLVKAFQDGGYELGVRAVANVPEPRAATGTLLGGFVLFAFRRVRKGR